MLHTRIYTVFYRIDVPVNLKLQQPVIVIISQ